MIYRKSPREQLVTSLILPEEPIKEQKSNNKFLIYDKKIPQSPKKQLDYTPLSPDYNMQPLLLKERNKAYKLTNFTQKQMIQNSQSLIQEKIHDLEGGQGQSKVLKNIFKNSVSPNQYIELGIEDVANNAIEKVAGGINEKTKLKRQVPLTKDDLKELQKVDKYRLLKIKNGQIKNKVGDLRNSLQKQYYERKANLKLPDYQNIKQSDYYSIDNPKTKEANEFIQKIKRKRQEEKMRYLQFLLKKSEEQKLKRQLEHQKKQLIAEQRKQRLQQQFQQKQLLKQRQLEQNLRKKEEFKQWSKVYQKQKPLYIRKQEQFIQKQLIPELEQKFHKIHEIKMQNLKRSQQLYEIDSHDHDQYYMEFKRDDRIRNEAQKEYQREKLKENEKQIEGLYKGKYRYLALQEMMNEKYRNQQNPREQQRYKRVRKLQYADQIKEKAIQQFKIKQMQTLGLEKKVFSKRTRSIDGSAMSLDGKDESKMTSYTDPKSQGKKNLHYLHELIKQKGVRKDRPYIKLIEQKNIYPDYLQQIREKRKINQQVLNLSGVRNEAKQGPIEQMLAKQKRMREELKRDEVRRKHNSLDYKQDANIQDKEIGAVKLKMKLISQLS